MTHWKKLTNPNYLGAYSLEDGKDIILTIDFVREETVVGTDGKKENCVVCHFKEKCLPMILNSTNMKMVAKVHKSNYIEDWQNKKIQIGMEKVKAFGEIVDALRVRNVVPREEKFICDNCGAEIQPMGNKSAQQLATYTQQKYGKKLCVKCATEAAKEVTNEAEQ